MPKKKTATDTTQPTLFPSENEAHLDISTLETWLLDAANTIRGASDAPKFKDFILPLIFYKRLSDVFDDEFAKQIEEFGSEELAREIVEADHEDALKSGRNSDRSLLHSAGISLESTSQPPRRWSFGRVCH